MIAKLLFFCVEKELQSKNYRTLVLRKSLFNFLFIKFYMNEDFFFVRSNLGRTN